MLGTVYIPPINSRFSSVDIFDDIENEIFCLSKENECVCLIGDFNSRRSTLRDYNESDETSQIFNNTKSDINFNWVSDELDVQSLEKYGLSIERKSKDNIVNSYGKRLVEVCKHCNMIILNGRSSSDQEGEFTCKKTSVVDYCISNTEFLKHVQDLRILPFSPFLSDVHNPIEVLLALGNQDNTESIYQQAQTKELAKKWNSEMKDTFHNHVEDKSENILMLTIKY